MSWKTSRNVTYSNGEIIQSVCILCKCSTNHKILTSVNVKTHSDYEDVSGYVDVFHEWAEHQVIECLGCSKVSFREEITSSDGIIEMPEINLYPNPSQRYPLRDISLIPRDDIKNIYSETLKAINNDQLILAGIGIRIILEAIMQEQQINGDNLAQKINNLVKQGIVTKKDADILDKIRRIGNNSAHSIRAYSSEEIKVAIDVIEHLFERIYIIPHRIANNVAFQIEKPL